MVSSTPIIDTEILLLDISGKIVATIPVDAGQRTTRIPINEFGKGAYFIKVRRNGLAFFTQKFIKL